MVKKQQDALMTIEELAVQARVEVYGNLTTCEPIETKGTGSWLKN